MRQPNWLALLLVLATPPSFAASKDAAQPDREMLRMIEFLREMEMLKQMELIREMQDLEHAGNPLPGPAPQKSAPPKKRETTK